MANPFAHVDTGFIVIDGKKYPTSGAWKPPAGFNYISGWVGNYSNNYHGTISIPAPYQPPEGYTFQVFTLESTGFVYLATRHYVRDTQRIEAGIYQGGVSKISDLRLVGWRLISTSTDPTRLQ